MSSETLDQPLDFDFLTPEERDAILTVLARDENLRRKEEERIERLKREIRELRAEEFSRISFDASKLCGRCLQEFGWLFNRGQVCSKCRLRVCKKCRQLLNNRTWLCLVCLRILELESQTGNWFYSHYPMNKKSNSSCQTISAIDIIRSSLSQSSDPDDTTLLIGQFKDHVTSMIHLPDAHKTNEEEDDESRPDVDSLFNKFLSTSTPNLSFKSAPQDRGSMTNLYIADPSELMDELHSSSMDPECRYDDEVFHVGNFQSPQVFSEHNHDFVTVSNKSVIIIKDDQETFSNGKTSYNNISSIEVPRVDIEKESIDNINGTVHLDDDDGGSTLSLDENQENEATCDVSPPTSLSDPVRLKVSALLAKYGRKEVTVEPYSSIYNSIMSNASGGGGEVTRSQTSDGLGFGDESREEPIKKVDDHIPPSLFSVIEVPTKNEFFPSEPMRPHTLDRKYRSQDDNFPSWEVSTRDQSSIIEDKSPAMESLGNEDEEDDPLKRFLRNEALLQMQQQHGEDRGFSPAVSWMPGGNYDLDWDAEDEEAPFSIQQYDHISTGFLDDEDEDGTKGAFSDLRSIINNILRQSSHEPSENDGEEGEEEDDDDEDERGDTLLLPTSSSFVPRNGIPMLRKKSLSVISEHTEPSACSSFDESFICEFSEKDETLLQNSSSLSSELH